MTTPRTHDERFTMVPDWLIESDLSLHDFAVLLVLMKHGRTTGRCNPGFATIARQARVSRDSVKRSLRSLEDRGLIAIERRRDGAKNLTNAYTLHVERDLVGRCSQHLGADSTQGETARVGAHSTQVGAHSTQGVGADSTPNETYYNESSERESEQRSARQAAVDIVEAEIVVDDAFDRVWAVWPKKTSKKDARLKFAAAAKRHPQGEHGLAADVVEHARAYAQHAHPVQFVPMLSTWLNGDRWEDELPGPRGDRLTQADRTKAVLARYAGPEGEAS